MYKLKYTPTGIVLILISSCVIMYFVEDSLSGYFSKSLWKIGAFLLLPLLFCLLDKSISVKDIFKINSIKQILSSLSLGVAVYALIYCGYLLFQGLIDLDKILEQLSDKVNVNKENFVFIALYISFINSLLEEFFFRGFGYLALKKSLNRFWAQIISALTFSLYHVAILSGWFSTGLFILIISGLFVAGLFFNWLNEKSNNIHNSWLVHMFANFSINTIGFIMFDMI